MAKSDSISNESIINGGSRVLVECQLCFNRISGSELVEHMKQVHNVADSALHDDKPLKSWAKLVG